MIEQIKKAYSTGKQIFLQKNQSYKIQGPTEVIWKSVICKNKKYPKDIFLVNSIMTFRNSVDGSRYDVYKFDKNGMYSEMDVSKLNKQFFRELEELQTVI